MEVKAGDIRVLINMLLISVTVAEFSDSQTHNSGFPHVVPNRQQFFELESITISCEGLSGLTGWRVMKKLNGDIRTCAPTWDRATGPCNIINAYPKTDSGEYWCEMGRTQRSNTVNITVTDGPVILESPVYPLLEGDNVTLLCKKKHAHPNITAEFFKNGAFIGIGSTGTLINPIVSKSDEGFYKCSISKTEESPESWLAVGRADAPPEVLRLDLYLVFGTGFCVLMVIILLLLAGVFQHQKHQQTIRRQIEETSLTPTGASMTESAQVTHTLITKPRMMKGASITNSTQSMRTLITRSKVDERINRSRLTGNSS